MNDVDYINTKYDNKISNYTNKYLESDIKYYYNTNDYYAGLDIKLFNDISKETNDDVMQNLPQITLHKYKSKLFIDNLTTSVNINYLRKTRKVGLGADTTNIQLPVSYFTYLQNDYLNLSFGEKFALTHIAYTNNNSNFEDATYISNTNFISLYTDLLKPYDTTIHNLKFSIDYEKPHSISTTGDIYGINNNNTELEKFLVSKSNETIKFTLNQTISDLDTLGDIIKHKMAQAYIYSNEENKYIAANLENDLTVYYPYGKINNRIIYNHDLHLITSSSTSFDFAYDEFSTNASYNYSKDNTTGDNSSRTLSYKLSYNFRPYYKTSYQVDSDLLNDTITKKTYIFNIDKKCWSVDLQLSDSLVATDTTNNSVIRQNILYIKFNLKQLFALNQVYKFKPSTE
jgi:hypothetical protein